MQRREPEQGLTLLCHSWHIFGMSAYDAIYDEAIGQFGLISTAQARRIGVSPLQLVKLARRGRLERVGCGLYKLAAALPYEGDAPAYALAVESVGEDAMLFGESVLGLLSLAPVATDRIFVGTRRRVRRRLPEGVVAVRVAEGALPAVYDGVRCQPVAEAIRSCRGRVMPERLLEAVAAARRQGLLSAGEASRLRKEFS